MTILEDVIKAVQTVVAPEMSALRERVDANHREVMLRFDGINQRFDDLLQRLEMERRLAAVERELDEKRVS